MTEYALGGSPLRAPHPRRARLPSLPDPGANRVPNRSVRRRSAAAAAHARWPRSASLSHIVNRRRESSFAAAAWYCWPSIGMANASSVVCSVIARSMSAVSSSTVRFRARWVREGERAAVAAMATRAASILSRMRRCQSNARCRAASPRFAIAFGRSDLLRQLSQGEIAHCHCQPGRTKRIDRPQHQAQQRCPCPAGHKRQRMPQGLLDRGSIPSQSDKVDSQDDHACRSDRLRHRAREGDHETEARGYNKGNQHGRNAAVAHRHSSCHAGHAAREQQCGNRRKARPVRAAIVDQDRLEPTQRRPARPPSRSSG